MRGVYILDLMVKISELEEISGQDIKNAANKQEHEPIDMICDILFNGKLSSSEHKVEEAAYKTYLGNVLNTYEKVYNDTLDNDLKSSMIQLSYILRAKDFVDRDTIVDMLQKFIAEYSFKISNERPLKWNTQHIITSISTDAYFCSKGELKWKLLLSKLQYLKKKVFTWKDCFMSITHL